MLFFLLGIAEASGQGIALKYSGDLLHAPEKSSSLAVQKPWYTFDRTYYKIQTDQDRMYKILPETLQQAGLNLKTVDPRWISLYHRGKEVAIYIQGEEDGQLDAGDYLLFYGGKNDATLDSLLFGDIPPANPFFNVHSDSTAFFLCVNSGTFGKRMNVQKVVQELPLSPYYLERKRIVFSEQYAMGAAYSLGFHLSKYDTGEGWMSLPVSKGGSRDVSFEELGEVGGPDGYVLELGLQGRSASLHQVRVQVGKDSYSLRELDPVSFDGYQSAQFLAELREADFDPAGKLFVRIRPDGPEPTDRIALTFAQLVYSKRAGGEVEESPQILMPSGEYRLEFRGESKSFKALEISDPDHPVLVELLPSQGSFSFQSTGQKDQELVHLESVSQIPMIEQMSSIRFRDLLREKADYLLIAHSSLQEPTGDFENPLQAYRDHRASLTGGAFSPGIFLMEELYNHFSFGEKTPLAIRNFLNAYYPVHRPTHLLLVGRGLGVNASVQKERQSFFYRKHPDVFAFQSLVPVGGYPFSDNVYGIGLDPSKPEVPALAIGRIPAKNSSELASYLQKVMEKDLLGLSDPWQKNILHLGGGISAYELDRFFGFLSRYKAIAEGPYLGAQVNTYRKRSNGSVEVVDIAGDLNEGRSLVTFFGHGSSDILDIDIGYASNPRLGYQNKGKYPVMLFNGCDYGNMFGSTYSQGEDWVMTPEKGAASILSNSSLGVDVYLNRYSTLFYQEAFGDSSRISRTLGEIKKDTEHRLIERFGLNPLNYSHMEQMILMGDPGVRIFPADKPDYRLDKEKVWLKSLDSTPISAGTDPLILSFVVQNIGITTADSIHFRISHFFPDGSRADFLDIQIPAISRLDTVEFTLPGNGVDLAGEHEFELEINSKGSVEEMTLENNQVRFRQFIPFSGPIPLYPYRDQLLTDPEIELVAQIPPFLQEERTILVQLDTTSGFDSPFRKEIRIASQGLARWKVALLSDFDSMTYYWRTKFQNPLPGERDDWEGAAFSYIPEGPEGWMQRQFAQQKENKLKNLQANESPPGFAYDKQTLEVEVVTVGTGMDTLSFRHTQVSIQSVPQLIDQVNGLSSRLCPDGSLGLLTFRNNSLDAYLPIPAEGLDIADPNTCGRTPQLIQRIQNAQLTRTGNSLLDDYAEAMETGDYVILFTVGAVNFEEWSEHTFARLMEFGADEKTLRSLRSGDPYILFGRKGLKPGEAIERVGDPDLNVPASQQTISLETKLEGFRSEGYLETHPIGPASQWGAFAQAINPRPWINEAKTGFDLIGIRPDNSEHLLAEKITDSKLDLSFIEAESYPYVKLRYTMEDPESTAPASLDYWQVGFEGVPEGVLLPRLDEAPLVLQEGLSGFFQYQFANISKYDFQDSIQVVWSLIHSETREKIEFSKKIQALEAGASLEDQLEIHVEGKTGTYSLEAFVNPKIQIEQTYRNNQVYFPDFVEVVRDPGQNILEVLFDGRPISDGEIVSPMVWIAAILRNDRAFSFKTDTLGLDLLLKRPCEFCTFERINFSDSKVTWNPAAEAVDFQVLYQPGPLADGVYILNVQQEDSPEPYVISFEVVNESSITHFFPYPNPFSTGVRFTYTVTGKEVPDEIKIQIFTVTGRLVREISQDELGPLRIGTNKSDFVWDGRGEFGGQLANGMYLYRVFVRKNGQYLELRTDSQDSAIPKGYGKLYLLR